MQTSTILLGILTCLLGSGGMVQFLLSRYDKRKEEESRRAELDSKKLEALTNLVCADIQDRLVRRVDVLVKRYNKSGQGISLIEKSTLKEMYSYYDALGWNHHAGEAMKELENIPVTE